MLQPDYEKLSSYLIETGKICEQFDFLKTFSLRLNELKAKVENSEIMITIVGEFNSGKSSLCNYLLGNNLLPVDVLPTTSTIWEIRFSSKEDKVDIIYSDSSTEAIKDFSLLKDKDLSNAKLVKVYSSSGIISNNVVIVDTPGLSSNIAEHEQILLDYVPNSDALILAVDANQGFTKTSLNFLKAVNPLNKRIYLIITKSDTKVPGETQDLIKYAREKLPIKPEKVIATSTKDKSTEDFKSLLFDIIHIKNEIIAENVKKELTNICNEIIDLLNLQLSSSEIDATEIERRIKEITSQRDRLREEVSKEIAIVQEKISEAEKEAVNNFESYMRKEVGRLVDVAFNKTEELESVFDDCVRNAINHAVQSYQESVKDTLKDMKSNLEDISKRVDIGRIPAITITKFIIEGVILVILDWLIPAGPLGKVGKVLEKGPIDALLVRLGMKLSEKWPRVKEFWDTILGPIREIIQSGVRWLAKSFVQNRIENAISEATRLFYSEVSSISKDIYEKLEKGIREEFSERERTVMESLESLRKEKRERLSEFDRYIESLKGARANVENMLRNL